MLKSILILMTFMFISITGYADQSLRVISVENTGHIDYTLELANNENDFVEQPWPVV